MKSRNFREKLKTYVFLFLIILVIIYAFFRVFNYLSGPRVTISSPQPYEIVSGEAFNIIGNVKNARNIYINGREINISQNGDFGERLVAKKPYTLVTVKAVDRYGKVTLKTLEIGVENLTN